MLVDEIGEKKANPRNRTKQSKQTSTQMNSRQLTEIFFLMKA
jgi:hypothetical protein